MNWNIRIPRRGQAPSSGAGPIRLRRALASLALLAALAEGAGCHRAFSRSKAPVILISIDTLRADHLPMYGYKEVETPALAALAKDSIVYGNAVSHVPLTLPSHTTVMTGLLPPQTSVRDNTGYVLPADRVTLAAELKKQGYATGGAVSTVVLLKASGVSRGFDFYDDDIEAKGPGLSIAMIQRSGMATEGILEGWAGGVERGPFFAFLHLYEPHTPYDPPEPYKSRYADRPYDGEIAAADAVVGKFVESLKRAGVYERALVILMSDHGEGLGDHGEDEHGVLLYRETLHVPLMVKLPGQERAGEKVGRVVGLVDIFPTVMEVLGYPAPAGLAGRSLLSGGDGARDVYSETLYPRYHYGWSDLAALTRERFEYIRGGSDEELYDYGADPGQKENLAGGLPPAFRSMRNALAGIARPRQAPGASDPEQLKKLAALGYLGSASPPENAENLPSPRTHIGEMTDLKEVLKLYSQKKYEESIRAGRDLLRKNPRMSDVWASIANSYHKLGRNDEAIAALKEQDKLSPGSPITLSSFATEYLEMGNLDEAKLYAERAIAVNGPAEAHEVLATIYLQKKQYDAAEQEALKAQGGYRQKRKPQVILAQVAKARGDLPGALAKLDEILRKSSEKEEGDLSNVNYLRGDILARMGRNAEAESAFKAEIASFPNNGQAWTALAVLYASEGRSDEARATLADFARKAPNGRTYQAIGETFDVLGSPDEGRRWKAMARSAGFRGTLPSGS
jgi:arylsulfatase A-like enzyme/Flp pilus assembly protein TadD